MSTLDPVSQNIAGVQSLIGSGLNKTSGGGLAEEHQGDPEDELTLKLTDEELIALSKRVEEKAVAYQAKLEPRQNANKTYYLGKQKEGSSQVSNEPISANIIFEAEETFLPSALSKNPEPVVYADNTPEGNKLAGDIKTMLQFHADILVLRRKLTKMTRKWSVDLLGVLKHGWDAEINDIKTEVRDVKNFLFDPDGYIDDYGDFIGLLGEKIPLSAQELSDLFPKHTAYITIAVDGKMGTRVTYTEWWNDKYTFCSFRGKILDKNKNPHFKYDKIENQTDQDGNALPHMIKGNNHFGRPKKPYTFLSVFSFGDHPHDETGLIEQNIPNQRRISRRTDQIDFNLSKANNSDVFSENNFNQETAKQASLAMAKGNPILVPQGGPIGEAIHRMEAPGLPAQFFTALENDKTDLRNIFGTQGITAQQQDENQTARGMILNQSHDTSRIGGGIGDAIEQVADSTFNWWVQLYHVYYDEAHFAAVMGQMKAVEYVTLSAQNFNKKVVVSVAPDSMKPKDETSQMNQALTLWQEGALDPKTLLTILDFPDPQNTAAQVMLFKTNPQMYMQLNFPDLANQIMAMQVPVQGAQPFQENPGGAPAEQPQPDSSLSTPPANPSLSTVALPKI